MEKYLRSTLVRLTVIAVIIGFFTSPVRADEIQELKAQLKLLQNRIEQLEANQKQQDKQIDVKVAEALETKQLDALPDTIKWLDRLKFSGDFRLRYEQFDWEDETDNAKGRSRGRYRYRFNIAAEVNEEVDVNLRLASGSDDPRSTNQSFDDGFTSKGVWIDRAYADWHPLSMPGLNVWGGKMPNPFYQVAKSQLIWDNDLNLEGFGAKYTIALNSSDELFLNGGGFWVEENSDDVDQSLWGAQAGIKHLFADQTVFTYGASYYDYGNIKGNGAVDFNDEDNFFGNSSTSDNKYEFDYNLIEAFGEYAFKMSDTPISVYSRYVNNTAAKSQDTGYLIGFKYNKIKDPGTWEFGYNYRDVEADAVLGAFTDSDFARGNTNGRGHKFSYKYQLSKNWQAVLTYFQDKAGVNKEDDRKLQADMIFKF